MITKSEYDTYNTHGCADYIEADRIKGQVAVARALATSSTQTDEARISSARLAFTDAAHYQRLAQFDGISHYAREFARFNAEFHRLRGELLLTDMSDSDINERGVALIKAHDSKFLDAIRADDADQ